MDLCEVCDVDRLLPLRERRPRGGPAAAGREQPELPAEKLRARAQRRRPGAALLMLAIFVSLDYPKHGRRGVPIYIFALYRT